jgi:hypothetical protein
MNNIETIENYLHSIGAQGSNIFTNDEDELNFLCSQWINYTLQDQDITLGRFLFRIRYEQSKNIIQIQFWGRDFYEEWLKDTDKVIYASMLANRINNRLNIGSLWLDLDLGAVAMVASMIVSNDSISEESIKNNMDELISTLNLYYPTFKKFIMSAGKKNDYQNALNSIS